MKSKNILFLECSTLYRRSKFSSAPVMDRIVEVTSCCVDYNWIKTSREMFEKIKREARTRKQGIVYISCHGSPGVIYLGLETVSLKKLAMRLKKALKGFDIFFSSCETLRLSSREIYFFLKKTDADSVCGYKNEFEIPDSLYDEVKLLTHLLKE